MLYPFLLMVSGSMKSEVDSREMDVIPRFLVNETALFRKFSEQRYARPDIATATTHTREANDSPLYSFESLPLPTEGSPSMMENWRKFLNSNRKSWPPYFESLGHVYGVRQMPEVTFKYINRLKKAFPEIPRKDINVTIIPEAWNERNYIPPQDKFGGEYWKMRSELSGRYFYPVSLDGYYALQVISMNYGTGVAELERMNHEMQSDYASRFDVILPGRLPENGRERELWSNYVRNYLSARFLRLDPQLLPAYRGFLREKYDTISALNDVHGSAWSSWEDVTLPGPDASIPGLSDTEIFIRSLPNLEGVYIESPEIRWRAWLQEEYEGDIGKLNAAWNSNHADFRAIPMPVAQHDLALLRAHKTEILWDMVTRNFRFAWEQIVVSGNGLRNTVIFCFLNVLTALIVNPLAAYALSRFQPRWGMTALFVLMATMAFPAEVTQIPSFLLLRELGLLNTFAALIIPAAANGYSIFLLKGFFDSLPTELYEAASIDGCGDLRAFFTITVPLSKPILAVIALGAFTSAYGAFMFALLVCQKESMWTLMVYLYQLQQSYNTPIVFAALIIAAIPTLVVFVLCQNIIMRGIVVPVEK